MLLYYVVSLCFIGPEKAIKYALFCIVGSLTSHRVMNKGCETGPMVYCPDLRRL